MWSRDEPNIGGLSKMTNGTIEVIDTVSTTGISSDKSLFVRALQHADHAVFHLYHRDGSTKQLEYKDLWDIHDVFLVKDHNGSENEKRLTGPQSRFSHFVFWVALPLSAAARQGSSAEQTTENV